MREETVIKLLENGASVEDIVKIVGLLNEDGIAPAPAPAPAPEKPYNFSEDFKKEMRELMQEYMRTFAVTNKDEHDNTMDFVSSIINPEGRKE